MEIIRVSSLAWFHGDSATSLQLQSVEPRGPGFSLRRIKTSSDGLGVHVFSVWGSSFDCECKSVAFPRESAHCRAADDAGRREPAGCRMETDERHRRTVVPSVGAAERPRQSAERQWYQYSITMAIASRIDLMAVGVTCPSFWTNRETSTPRS